MGVGQAHSQFRRHVHQTKVLASSSNCGFPFLKGFKGIFAMNFEHWKCFSFSGSHDEIIMDTVQAELPLDAKSTLGEALGKTVIVLQFSPERIMRTTAASHPRPKINGKFSLQIKKKSSPSTTSPKPATTKPSPLCKKDNYQEKPSIPQRIPRLYSPRN